MFDPILLGQLRYVWIGITVAIIVLLWLKNYPTVGLPLAYLLDMWMNHGIAAFLYDNMMYPEHSLMFSYSGFVLSTLGLVGLALGCLMVGPLISRRWTPTLIPPHLTAPKREFEKTYIAVGLFSYFVLLPVSYLIPSGSAIIVSGWRLFQVGLSLSLWRAWQNRNLKKFFLYLSVTLIAIPMMTLLGRGFISYASVAIAIVLSFVVCFAKPRWVIPVLVALCMYGSVSFFINYMWARSNIRTAVWGNTGGLGGKLEAASTIFTDFQWFDVNNPDHLIPIDTRLNQNYLVGAGQDYIEAGFENHAHGATVRDSFLALIPRAIWPNKPAFGGSGGLVSKYTGIDFAAGTSVGIGTVLELFANFGKKGVFIGFLLIGTLLSIVDQTAGRALREGNWESLSLWYLIGITMVNVIGAFSEVTAGIGGSCAFIWLVHQYILPRHMRRLEQKNN